MPLPGSGRRCSSSAWMWYILPAIFWFGVASSEVPRTGFKGRVATDCRGRVAVSSFMVHVRVGILTTAAPVSSTYGLSGDACRGFTGSLRFRANGRSESAGHPVPRHFGKQASRSFHGGSPGSSRSFDWAGGTTGPHAIEPLRNFRSQKHGCPLKRPSTGSAVSLPIRRVWLVQADSSPERCPPNPVAG